MAGDPKLVNLHYRISEILEEISGMFSTETKITLIVRTPKLQDGGVLISDDDYDAAIAEINRLRKNKPVVDANATS